jgi:uncharacterized protein YjiS (DUF1127 family)
MTECIDTILARPGPLEAAAAWISAGLVHAARLIDRGVVRLLDVLYEWRARAAERHVMRTLDDRMLRDVGLSRADLERELHKPFWER